LPPTTIKTLASHDYKDFETIMFGDRQTDRLRFEVVEAFDLPAKFAGVDWPGK